jgi:tripartite-type tricarboxylate transporter receptor subunit TctC
MTRFSTLTAALALIATALVSSAPAQASDWPSRSVTVIVPFGAGGNTDMMARLATQHLSTKFNQSFVVENRPSAGGALGTGQVANAAPDGYTILFSAAANINLTPQLQKLSYDPVKQLVPVVNVGTGTQTLAVNRKVPVTTLAELIAYAKANPGKLNFTAAGTQNISHLAPVLLFALAGLDLVFIPAKAGPQAVSDVISGQVDVYFGNSSELLPHINSDKIRLLATGASKRLDGAPDLPTVSETVLGFEFSSWNGFSVPTGTPEPIINAIRTEVTALVKTPQVSERLTKLGIMPGGMTKEEVEAYFKKDREALTAAVKAAKIEQTQ